MQTVGASRTFAPRALHSSPKCRPISSIMSKFHVEAMEIPHGNSAAYHSQSGATSSLGLFRELTGVPFVKNSPRAPLGPSVVFIDGVPFSGMGMVRQKSAPANNDIYGCQLTIVGNGVRLPMEYSSATRSR